MAGYYERVAQPGETLRYRGRLHWNVYTTGVVVLALAVVILFVPAFVTMPADAGALIEWLALGVGLVGLAYLAAAGMRRLSTEIVVTDRRVLYKRGVLSRFTVEMNMSKVETVDVDQGLTGRMFDFGTVLIRGTGSTFEPLRDVQSPLALRQAIIAG